MRNYCLIMARPQLTTQERNFLAFEYHKRKGHRNLMPCLIMDFERKFLNARQPALCHVRRIYKKAMEIGTVLNVNSKTSQIHPVEDPDMSELLEMLSGLLQ